MTPYPQYRKQAVLKIVRDFLSGDERYALVELDVYDVLTAFQITNPAQQHAIKKILRAGNDHLSFEADMQEVKDSLDRAVQLEKVKGMGGEQVATGKHYDCWRAHCGSIYRGKIDVWCEAFFEKDESSPCRWIRQDGPIRTAELNTFRPISEAEARKLVEEAGGVW